MSKIVDPLFKKPKYKGHSKRKDHMYTSKKWFDTSCSEKRKIFRRNLKTYTKDKSNANRQNMTEARAEYKSHIRKKQYMYKKR